MLHAATSPEAEYWTRLVSHSLRRGVIHAHIHNYAVEECAVAQVQFNVKSRVYPFYRCPWLRDCDLSHHLNDIIRVTPLLLSAVNHSPCALPNDGVQAMSSSLGLVQRNIQVKSANATPILVQHLREELPG